MSKPLDHRLLMPATSSLVDRFKDVFGSDQVKISLAEENGISLRTSESNKTYQEFPAFGERPL